MSLGFGQILIILIFGLLLFGNLPKIFKDLGKGINELKSITKVETSNIKDSKILKKNK
jgi:Sec-independent protein translocase protein TatA